MALTNRTTPAIPKNSVWSAMSYPPPRGRCNHKPSLMSPACSCLRFMLHPVKAATSFECDGCGHHASFHSLENKDEDAIVRKWGEAEEAEREREKQAKAGAGGKRKRGAGKEGDGARLQIEGPKVVEISEEDAELLSAAKRAKENKEFQRRFIEIKRREFEENRALRNEEEDQAERELFRKEQEEKELRTHLWDKLIDQADLPRPRRRFART